MSFNSPLRFTPLSKSHWLFFIFGTLGVSLFCHRTALRLYGVIEIQPLEAVKISHILNYSQYYFIILSKIPFTVLTNASAGSIGVSRYACVSSDMRSAALYSAPACFTFAK